MLRYTFRTLVCIAVFITISACSTMKIPRLIPVYAGDLRPLDEVGVFLNHQSIHIYTIDGVSLEDYLRPEFPLTLAGRETEILPGKHVIEFTFYFDKIISVSHSTSPVKKIVNVEAGHIYNLSFADTARNKWDVKILDASATERADVVARRASIHAKGATKIAE